MKIIGQQTSFAIAVDILAYQPSIFGKCCFWINNFQIGDLEDSNELGPFMRSMMRMATQYQTFWLDELGGLACKELLLKIFPFIDNPEEFYDLSAEEQQKLVKFDRFIFNLGENFDRCVFSLVVRQSTCKFLWIIDPPKMTKPISELVNCFDVSLEEVISVYREFCNTIPIEHWPKYLHRLE